MKMSETDSNVHFGSNDAAFSKTIKHLDSVISSLFNNFVSALQVDHPPVNGSVITHVFV